MKTIEEIKNAYLQNKAELELRYAENLFTQFTEAYDENPDMTKECITGYEEECLEANQKAYMAAEKFYAAQTQVQNLGGYDDMIEYLPALYVAKKNLLWIQHGANAMQTMLMRVRTSMDIMQETMISFDDIDELKSQIQSVYNGTVSLLNDL